MVDIWPKSPPNVYRSGLKFTLHHCWLIIPYGITSSKGFQRIYLVRQQPVRGGDHKHKIYNFAFGHIYRTKFIFNSQQYFSFPNFQCCNYLGGAGCQQRQKMSMNIIIRILCGIPYAKGDSFLLLPWAYL